MKSLIKKKDVKLKIQKTQKKKVAQCCAKISSKVAGCHD